MASITHPPSLAFFVRIRRKMLIT